MSTAHRKRQGKREGDYALQNRNRRGLTPRQLRRMRHKFGRLLAQPLHPAEVEP